MKIMLVDNYDTGMYQPVVIAEKVHPGFAEKIANLLNEEEEAKYGLYSPNYYMVKED